MSLRTVLGGSLVLKGYIQVGDIQAFIQYIQQFNQPVMQIANISSVIQSTVAAAERVFEFLEQPDEKITWQGDGEVIDHVTGQVAYLTTLSSAMTRTASSSTTLAPTSSQAKRLPLSGQLAPQDNYD